MVMSPHRVRAIVHRASFSKGGKGGYSCFHDIPVTSNFDSSVALTDAET